MITQCTSPASSAPHTGAEVALLVELRRDPRHRRRALLLAAGHRAADRVLVELRHRREAPPVTTRRLDAMTARALGILGGASLLVRPDGVPAMA